MDRNFDYSVGNDTIFLILNENISCLCIGKMVEYPGIEAAAATQLKASVERKYHSYLMSMHYLMTAVVGTYSKSFYLASLTSLIAPNLTNIFFALDRFM